MSQPSFDDLVAHIQANHLDLYAEHLEDPVELALVVYQHASADERAEDLAAMIELSAESKYEWDALSRIAQSALSDRQPLPQNLADWISDALSHRHERPKGGSGTVARDMLFCEAIRDLQDRFGLTPMRSSASEALSACDVVATASGYSYKTIEKAWNRRDT